MTTIRSQLNLILPQTSHNSIITNFNNYNHEQIIELSTKTITYVQQLQLVTFLNIRAHAYGMKGYFDEAVQDAREIIKYVPERGIGYLRLGNLLYMQGKQSAAISLYAQALSRVSQQDPDYEQLIKDKKRAEEKNEKHVDMLTMLPIELVHKIFEYLPDITKMISCMDVSKGWRKKTSQSPILWRRLLDDFNGYDDETITLVSRVVPYIAHHVKELTIGMKNKELGYTYLNYMEKGYFKKITNLTLKDEAVNCIPLMPFMNGLWQTRNTISGLDITSTDCKDTKIRISDLLFYCKNLKTLVMDLDCSLDTFIGEMEYLDAPYNTLIDVELTTSHTTGQSLRPLLQYCPKIRRLCLNGCTPDVVDVVDELYNENLEIFAYNPSFGITSLEEKDAEFYDGPPGLREIYTPNGGCGVPVASFLRLVRKNQRSLQTVYANTQMTDEQEARGEPYPDFRPVYDQWYFERLQHLTYWPDIYNVTEPMFLESTKLCTTNSLMLFSAVCTPNIPMIVDTLMKLPPVENIELSHIKYDDNNSYLRSSAILQLLERYAALPKFKNQFRRFWFEYCDFITDNVLDILTRIETINIVYFSGTCTVPSHESFLLFLQKIRHRLVEVMFVDIDHVGDDVLNLLCEMEGLKTITLEKIIGITEEGIKYLADNAKALRDLTLENCTVLSDDTISYINKKIKNVEIITN